MSANGRPETLGRSQPKALRRVTLADVARDAGVHKATASRALRGLPGVDAGTRLRVLESARRLSFSASAAATALATGRSKTVGLVLPTLRSWYFSEVAAGASEVLSSAGYRIELVNLDVDSDFLDIDSPAFHDLMLELGAGHGRDALLFAGTIARSEGEHQVTGAVPAAVAGTSITQVRGLAVDNRSGGRLVGGHLAGLGHRRLTVIEGRSAGSDRASVWQHRTQGFLEICPDADVLTAGDGDAANGHRAMTHLITAGGPLPTAVFCHTDELAFGALAALRGAGLRCPEDVSVAAFDDHPMARYWGLTTVSQHAHQQGVRAAAALLERLHVPVDPAETAALDALRVKLVIRETTAEPTHQLRGHQLRERSISRRSE
ncbi:MAG TPA: LacI family DNA-binding transcriptional regulator [Propionibacteriaceae bacterium]|nr:LacI family DNA-binding transcriptional regulator [Propionibacteriaceae bacterium]